MGIAVVRIGDGARVLNGLRLRGYLGTVPRTLKSLLPEYWVEPDQISHWVESVKKLASDGNDFIRQNVETSLGMYHDVQTSVSSILRNAEEFVRRQPGNSTDERFESLPATAKSMIKSVELLEARLALMPLVSNPAAARFGKRHSIPVYKSIDRLVRILRSTAQRRGIDIRLSGNSKIAVSGFDSFDTVPLVLIENAIKYSKDGDTVSVDIVDVVSGVQVKISSYSPQIPVEHRAKIFERGVRGPTAAQVVSQGSGLGLYLARIVAQAHGFEISLRCGEARGDQEGVPYCTNVFEFTVPQYSNPQN